MANKAETRGVLHVSAFNGFGRFIGGILVAIPFHPHIGGWTIDPKGLLVRSAYGIWALDASMA